MSTLDKTIRKQEWISTIRDAIVKAAAEREFSCMTSVWHITLDEVTVEALVTHPVEDMESVRTMVDFDRLPEVLKYTINGNCYSTFKRPIMITKIIVYRRTPPREPSFWGAVCEGLEGILGLR